MRTIFLFLACTCFTFFSNASVSIDWLKYGIVSSGKAIAADLNDNVYDASVASGMIVIKKRDRFGNFLWEQTSSTTIQFNYETPVQVFTDPAGFPVVVGYRYTQSSSGYNANAIIVLKYDLSGNLIYKKTFTGTFSYFNNSQYWTKLSSQMDAAGNLYIGMAGVYSGSITGGFNVFKIDPQGNLVHHNVKQFSSATNFHFIHKLRLNNNLIGIAGVTSYAHANASMWVLDTAGNDIHDTIVPGIQGVDILFDASANTYLLTSISVSSFTDLHIYKFSSAGNQIWDLPYDFGGSELPVRMEMSPDSTIVLISVGNQAPTSSYYVDWLTFKINLSGIVLWSDRYDEHTNNDEMPYMMVIDNLNNIFVTGIGGPFPGGSNLGARQMATVKYTPAGSREWTAVIDTLNEYMTGVGIALAHDSSLFVLGDVNSMVVHYLDHSGNDPCSQPTGISLLSVQSDSVIISWNAVPNAFLYHVQYKVSTSAVWITLSTDSNSILITPLYNGTLYDYRVEAICNSGPTGYSATQQFTTTGNGYCTSMGMDGTHEWIDFVMLSNLSNSTPNTDSGYANYTHLSAHLIAGSTYDITTSAETDSGITYLEYWKVWIDFNQNNSFSDPGEEVVSFSSNQIGWETHNFQVPSGALTGTTLMRVSMKFDSAQTPCEIFPRGEVEDYSVNITGITGFNLMDNSSTPVLFPNPADGGFVKISNAQTYSSIIFTDVTGKIIKSISNNSHNMIAVNVEDLSPGVYIVTFSNPEQTFSVRMIR
jgi:hypothetical protein